MKRILFVIGQLRVGGVSKALIELLRSIEGKYDVSLLCFDHDGHFFHDVPKSVRILPTTHILEMTERSAADAKAAGWQYGLLRYAFSFAAKMVSKKAAARALTRLVGTIDGAYDLAVAYSHPMPDQMFCNLGGEVVLECVKAQRKAIFIHCDFSAYGGNTAYNRQLLQRFDVVAAVSKSVGRNVAQCVPEIADRLMVVPNCHDFETIKRMAAAHPVVYHHRYNFVTVARLSEEKGLLRCIPIFAKLHEQGYDVGWLIVGGGPLAQRLRDTIKNYQALDYIRLEGEQTNSYRYIKNADCLLLVSFHEAAPMVYDEAACLGVPVISTRTLSAVEMVEERGIGWVCDNDDAGIEAALRQVMKTGKTKICAVVNNDEALAGLDKLCEV